MMLYIDALTTSTIAILLLFAGKAIVSRFEIFKRYSIPEPVIGGIVCAAVVSGIYLLHGSKIEFDIGIRDTLLLPDRSMPISSATWKRVICSSA
ncbi:sodium/glutamate symporter [Sphingobium sp.]|uniref:sodium/glutamate symporter n=1 Tax=Sphingobium sp. TaxID=1912891 RepID=UPI002D8029CD|nr:sodium/glutamate symporter [Sphingobium sp.]